MPEDSEGLEQRLAILTDFETLAANRAELFELVVSAADFEDMAERVAQRFAIRPEHARILLGLPTYHWGLEGVRKRAAELEQLRARLGSA